MVWLWTGDKPLFEPVIVCWHVYTSLELTSMTKHKCLVELKSLYNCWFSLSLLFNPLKIQNQTQINSHSASFFGFLKSQQTGKCHIRSEMQLTIISSHLPFQFIWCVTSVALSELCSRWRYENKCCHWGLQGCNWGQNIFNSFPPERSNCDLKWVILKLICQG